MYSYLHCTRMDRQIMSMALSCKVDVHICTMKSVADSHCLSLSQHRYTPHTRTHNHVHYITEGYVLSTWLQRAYTGSHMLGSDTVVERVVRSDAEASSSSEHGSCCSTASLLCAGSSLGSRPDVAASAYDSPELLHQNVYGSSCEQRPPAHLPGTVLRL